MLLTKLYNSSTVTLTPFSIFKDLKSKSFIQLFIPLTFLIFESTTFCAR